MDRIVAETIAAEIDPEDIFYVVSGMNQKQEEGSNPDWYSAVFLLFDRFPPGSRKPFAIMSRMEALKPMLSDKRAQGWSFEMAQKGAAMMHPAMFRATALAPLYEKKNGKGVRFKREEF